MTVYERNLLLRALEKHAWNVTRTARYLGLPLSTMKFKIEKFGVREAARKYGIDDCRLTIADYGASGCRPAFRSRNRQSSVVVATTCAAARRLSAPSESAP